MPSAHDLIRTARLEAGLTQARLATAMGTTQSAVARLESPGANPRWRTIVLALGAAGRTPRLELEPRPVGVDEGQIAELVRLSPAERLRTFEASHRSLSSLAARVHRIVDGPSPASR